MKKLPDIVLVADGHYENLAITEAKTMGVTTISMLGSTGDIDKTDFFIPCNVNSIKAIAFILGEIKSSIKARKTEDKKPLGGQVKTEKLPMKGAKKTAE